MSFYTVKSGDCLSTIAAQYGFHNYRTIYDHPGNAALKAKRPNPNIIYPGDIVFIPDKETKALVVPAGAPHSFQLTTHQTRFRVRIQLGVPFTYHLDIEGDAFDGAVADGTVIDVPIPSHARVGKLSLWPNNETDKDPMALNVNLGGLDPIEEVTGIQARLNNLGFNSGPVDGKVGPKTRRAVRAFQEVSGLDITGEIDDNTRDEIKARHDI